MPVLFENQTNVTCQSGLTLCQFYLATDVHRFHTYLVLSMGFYNYVLDFDSKNVVRMRNATPEDLETSNIVKLPSQRASFCFDCTCRQRLASIIDAENVSYSPASLTCRTVCVLVLQLCGYSMDQIEAAFKQLSITHTLTLPDDAIAGARWFSTYISEKFSL